jgi:hypothetical protein
LLHYIFARDISHKYKIKIIYGAKIQKLMQIITKRAMNIPIIMAYSWLLSKKLYRKEADQSIVSL